MNRLSIWLASRRETEKNKFPSDVGGTGEDKNKGHMLK